MTKYIFYLEKGFWEKVLSGLMMSNKHM